MLPFLNHEENMSFKGKRMAYEGPEKKEAVPEAKEKPLTTDEKKEVIKDLQTKTMDADYDTAKPPTESFAKLAKKLYPQNAAKENFATMVLDETFGEGATRAQNATKLSEQDCKVVRIEDGVMKFYKSKEFKPENEIKLTEAGVPIKTPSLEEPKPEAPKGQAAEQILSTEPNPEQKQAIEFFKKAFPNAKPNQIRVSATETVGVGQKAHLYLSSYTGGGPGSESYQGPDYYNESGKAGNLFPDQLRTGAYVPAEIQKGFVIEAPKANGVMGRFVLVKLSIDPYIGQPGERMAWVEVGKLRRERNADKRFRTENAWSKAEETTETMAAGTYKARYETPLYSGKSALAGTMVRKVEADDEVKIIEGKKTLKVGNDEYVAVTLTKGGATDRGWIKKDAIVEQKAAAKEPEVAYKEKKDERADEEMVAKYYNRETGLIHFDGDKKAENTITITDLFPNAKAGDKLRIKRKAGGKMMEATFDPNKEYTKYFKDGRKAEKRKGTFSFKNGQRVEIWDGDIILPGWEEEKAAEGPKDRAYLEKVVLKQGDTYESVAAKAMGMEAIKKAFEGSKFTEPEKIAAYVKLLKQYQEGNNLFLVVPTSIEAGVPTAAELAEARFSERAQSYAKKFETNRAEAEKALRKDLDKYMKEKVKVRPSLLSIVDDDEEFRRAWNGDINKELVGLNRLIIVLKHPVFAEAGINESNAREKIRDLIQEYSNKEVDFEDVVNFLGIYRKRDPLGGPDQKGSYSDFKSDLEKETKIMKENEAGMKRFEAKKGEGVLKQTEIVKVVMEKKNLALAQGYENPFALVTPDQMKAYQAAMKALDEVKNDPDYQAWDKYRLASANVGYMNYVLMAGAQLLEAIGQLEVKEFKADTASMAVEAAKVGPETQKCVDAMADVFADAKREEWRKENPGKRNFSWEDVVAGTEKDQEELSHFEQYFDPYAPVVRMRSRLNKYTDEKGQLDGVERISEADTVKEFNRLMKKALKRLIAWKNNPTAVAEFLNKYSDTKVSLPEKNKDESDEAYATRVAPMVTGAVNGAFEKLKVNGFADLQAKPDDAASYKEMVQDRKDLIKMGYYFDSRDEERGVVEGKEGAEVQLSMNPMIRRVQEEAIAKGYPPEKAKQIESIFLLGIGFKIDTTKPLNQAFGLGLGTGIDLGDGFTLMVGVGVDQIGPNPNPMVGVAIRKGWKLSEDKRTEIGVSGGVGVGLTGPSIGGGVDVTWPVSSRLDMKAFAGGSAGILVAGVGGGIGIAHNFEAANKALQEEIGGFDPKAIDAEKDPDKKYQMIINHPQIGPYYRAAAMEFPKLEDQKTVVLDLYQAHRASVGAKAAEEASAPFISGGGIAAGVAFIAGVPIPFVGPYLQFTVGKTVLVYRRQSESSKQMDKVSEAEAQRIIAEDIKKKYPEGNVVFKEAQAGQSGDVMVDAQGNIAIRKNHFQVDLAPFKENPSIDKYNEALKPYDMKLVPDAATGLLEFQVFGALGNLKIFMDPGMEKKGLILKDGKVFLAPGAKPELFITREEFFTPFPKEGYYQETVICITDTPKRTRSTITNEAYQSGAYMYRKAGKQWEIMTAPGAANANVMDAAAYEKTKANYELYSEKIEGFDEKAWKAYEAKINSLPFVKDPEPELKLEKQKELKDFSKKFLARNLQKYKEYTTVKPTDSEEAVNEKRRKLAELIQGDAKKETSKGGLGAELSDLQMNFVMSELMDLSFSELEKAPDKRARFEQNLEWSRNAVLLPFFRKKIKELNDRAEKEGRPELKINSTPEQLVDLVVKRLLANVKDDELGKPGEKLGQNWMFSSVAGAIGTGMRGVPGYISQDKYGVLGLHEEDLTKPGIEGELARIILELESPLDRSSDKAMMEGPLAKKLIAMPGMWFVLGDAMANEAVDGMQKAIKGEKVDESNKGYQEFKKILLAIRDTQLRGGNAYIYNSPTGNSFEFRLKTKVADAAHARCGNASFGVQEDIQIFVRLKKETGMIVAAGKESVATVSPETVSRFLTLGLAGIVTIDVGPSGGGGGGETPKVETKEEGGVVEGGGSGQGQGSQGGTQGGPVAPPGDSTPPPSGENPPPSTF